VRDNMPRYPFVCLQNPSPVRRGDGRLHAAEGGRIVALPAGGIVDLSPELHDFAETAGAIANLDLVIGVDTAVVHVAGAVAKPVWVMLPFSPDWRWMLERNDSPWYPSLRLYRQPAPGDWGSVIEHVAADLARLVAKHAAAAQTTTA
jgi:ADP-heptose:LPS heptosyltransferase